MTVSSELLTRNIEVLKSRVNRHGLYGLSIAIATIAVSTVVVAYQMTGEVTFNTLLHAQENNFALRILDLMPFVFSLWGQYTGADMARHASTIIMAETDELRTEATAWKKKSLHDATHDALTELPNRALFYERLRQAILTALRENRTITILLVDLDDFTEINSVYGLRSGDLILKEIAERLQCLIQSHDTVARIGGDEFALLLTDITTTEEAINEANRIQKAFKSAFILDDTSIGVHVSIGISHCPNHGKDEGLLIQRTEIATSAAKQTQVGYAVYSDQLNQDNPRRVMLLGELRHAIENDQLTLHFQPKINMRTRKIISVEALVRWTHQEHGFISPGEFVPLAEQSRLIRPLTNWVITTATKVSESWHKSGINIGMAINISARDLNDPELPDIFSRLLTMHEVNPEWFTLEITESSIMDDSTQALDVLNKLSSMQLGLSIDDFGTGYSSLAYLSKLPVQELKIDQTFILGMTENKRDSLIVSSTIDLGHNLGLKVIAEGIENEETWHMLDQLNCDIAQGYYISPPLPETTFLEWLQGSRWGSNAKN